MHRDKLESFTFFLVHHLYPVLVSPFSTSSTTLPFLSLPFLGFLSHLKVVSSLLSFVRRQNTTRKVGTCIQLLRIVSNDSRVAYWYSIIDQTKFMKRKCFESNNCLIQLNEIVKKVCKSVCQKT